VYRKERREEGKRHGRKDRGEEKTSPRGRDRQTDTVA
jgi:hypothetical protein